MVLLHTDTFEGHDSFSAREDDKLWVRCPCGLHTCMIKPGAGACDGSVQRLGVAVSAEESIPCQRPPIDRGLGTNPS